MNRTTNGFDKSNEDEFAAMLNNICVKMLGNADFPGLQASVIALIASREEYLVLAAKAVKGSKLSQMERDEKRAAIVVDLRAMGAQVTALSLGNRLMLEGSGFSFLQVRQPTPPLVTPQAPRVGLGGNNGEIVCKAATQPGGMAYTYYVSDDPASEGSWKPYQWAKSSFTFSNLKGGTRYYFRYQLCGVREQCVMSGTSSFIPQ